ncbi:glycerophosphodiester phosphodiesterase family protein [Arcticibacterium luteifluviistationis]|uniref:Glycerophosphodiester phosphodiesterase n=1 Tax=Arcticibacterium luteifluviistationis TaxID=1784714 RepID=A0A2Z4G7G4_9BACT|nr:glycerophosphodiester phosphodiesterase family protein [Arcticibacterium luteifluviistationis]AWV97055.1 glycerophosphodiester phosphodiesterase [Arcticibacterium luteifluviistationis]
MKIKYLVKSVLFFFLVSPVAMAQDFLQEAFFAQDASKVLVAAHRAAHNFAPENSLLSVENAIKEGIDIIEIDVKTSKDGVVMLMHDGTIDRTTNGTGKLENYTFEELRKLRLKNADGTLSKHQIPTLEEVLHLANGHILIDLDLKLKNIKPVIVDVQRTSMQKQVFFFDSDYSVLKKIKRIDPSLYLMPRTHSDKEVAKAIRIFDPVIIHIDPSFYTKALVDDLKSKNIKVWINAFGKVDKSLAEGSNDLLMDFLKNGANVLQTDQPEKMLKSLKSAGLHQ